MEDQDRVLDEYMVLLGWRAVHPVHAHASLGEPIGGNLKAELERLQHENASLKQQVVARFDETYAGNYDEDPHRRLAQLMTRNAILETELENYQKYMRTVTKTHQSEKNKMKIKIKELKRKLRQSGS
jgi:hypothetical protein